MDGKKIMTKRISLAARVLAIGVVAALFIVSFAVTGMAAPALSNSGGGSWQYYKEITVSNSGGALSDYQVLVQLSSSSFPTNARSDGADIRFADANEKEFSYWIETWDYSGKNALVWVKVPIIPAAATVTVRMYYGNPAASSSNNGDATFEFFDDFDGTSLNLKKWTYNNKGSVSISNSKLSVTGRDAIINSIPTFSMLQNILESKIKEPGVSYVKDSVGSNTHLPGWSDPGYNTCIPSCVRAQHYFSYGGALWFVSTNGVERYVPRNELYNNYDVLGISVVNSGTSDFYKNYVKVYSFSPPGGINTGGTSGINMVTQLLGGDYLYVDWIRVRKYTSQEPTLSLSAEQLVLKEPSTIATAAPTVSRTGLVAEYHFDGDAKDSSGNGNDGTIKGATFVQGVSGQALSFDGVNAGVNFGDPASGTLDFGATDSFTVELFGKFDGFSSPRWLIQKGGPNLGLPGYGIAHDTNILEFTIGDPIGSGPNTPVSSLSTGKWYHIAGVRDVVEDKIKLYVDGVLVNVVTDTTTGTLATTSSFFIGRRSDGYYFDGSIDEVRIYNRALSAEEIKANYASIIGKSPATTATKPASAPTSSAASPAPTIAQTTIPTPAPTAAPESSNSYVYAGIGGIILLLVAIVALKRRSSSKVEEPLKREPAVKPEPHKPTPLAEPPKIKPVPMTVPEAPGVYVKTAFGYKGAAIIYKLKIENNTSDPISDIKVYPYIPDVFLLKEKEKSIALIEPKSSQTVTFEIRPTGECRDCNVSGRVNYYDMASRKRQDIELEQKSLSIVCPMLHGKEISETEWYDVVGNLVKTEESTREIGMPADSLFTMVTRVIKDMHMHMQKPEVTKNHKLFNGVARFYGEGVKGLKYAAQVEVVGGAKKSKLILKVWAEKEEALTGFYHGMLDEIEKRVNVKEYIDDSIVQYNVHIGDKIGTLVKDSVVQRSTIGASVRKCPNCGREVEANEKFCLECGAKL